MRAKHKWITLRRKIFVDDCLSEELKKLNNEHGVMTLSSCCGHKETQRYIAVYPECVDKMITLGYKPIGVNTVSCKGQYEMKLVCFEPKSMCYCEEVI
jgi:hypothetical protein